MLLSPERRKSLALKAEGYAANVEEALPYLATRGISEEVADLFGLGFVLDGQNAGRMSIPYITQSGVVQIKYRCIKLEEHNCTAKYVGEAGCGTTLFNARALVGAGETVILTEGEMDAISVQAATGLPSIGYPGVKNWKSYYRLCFEGVREVLVIADGDDVGRKAAQQISERLGMVARVIDLGDGYDSNRFITELGAEAFTERLRS